MGWKKKILWSLALFAALLVLAAVVVARSGLLADRFKAGLVQRFEAETGRSLQIGSMEGGLFGDLVLKDVRVGPPRSGPQTELKAESIVISFSLWHLFFHRKDLAATLRQIELFGPQVLLTLPPGTPGPYQAPDLQSFLPATSKFSLPVPVKFHDLSLLVASAAAPARPWLTHASGQLAHRLGSLSLKLSGLPMDQAGSRMDVDGKWSLLTNKGSLAVGLKEFPLSTLDPRVTGGKISGRVIFEPSRSHAGQWVLGLSTRGQFEFRDLEVSRVRHAGGALSLDDRRAELKGLKFQEGNREWEASATLEALPSLQTRLKASSNLGSLEGRLKLTGTRLWLDEGRALAAGSSWEVKGWADTRPGASPAWAMDFSTPRLSLASETLKDLRGWAREDAGQVRAGAAFAWRDSPHLNLSGRLEAAPGGLKATGLKLVNGGRPLAGAEGSLGWDESGFSAAAVLNQEKGGRLEASFKTMAGRFKLDAGGKKWAMGGKQWDGRLKLEGGLGSRSTGDASLSAWGHDGQSWPDLNLSWQKTPAGRWQVDRLAWGALSGEASLTLDKDLRLEISLKEPAGGTATLRGDLSQGAAGTLSGTAQLAGFDAGQIPGFWGSPRDEGMKGRVDARFFLSGTLARPQVAGKLSVLHPGWQGASFGRLEAEGNFKAGSADLSRLQIFSPPAVLSLSACKVRRQGSDWTAEGDLDVRDATLFEIFRTSGQARVRLDVDPAREIFKVSGNFREMKVNQLSLATFPFKARWDGRRLSVDTGGNAEGWSGEGVFTGAQAFHINSCEARTGGGRLRLSGGRDQTGTFDLKVEAKNYPAADISDLIGLPLDWEGRAWGSATLKGPPSDLRLVSTAKVESGSLNRIPFDTASGTLLLERGLLDLSPYKAPCLLTKKDKYTARLYGTIPVAENGKGSPGEMNLRLSMTQGDLSFLRAFDGVEDAGGPVDMELAVAGTPAYPSISGKVQSSGGWLTARALFGRIEKLKISLVLDQNRVGIYDFKGQAGEEGQILKVEAGPAADPVSGGPNGLTRTALVLKQFSPDQWNVRISTGKYGIRLVNRPALKLAEGTVKGAVLIQGPQEHPSVTGKIEFQDCVITYPPVTLAAAPGTREGREGEEEGESFVARSGWNLELRGAKNVHYVNDFADVELATGPEGLVLRGPGSAPALSGSLRAVRGEIYYLGSSFLIDPSETRRLSAPDEVSQATPQAIGLPETGQESTVVFRDGEPPRLDVHAYQLFRHVRLSDDPMPKDRKVYLDAQGPLGNVKPRFSSEPRMSQLQIASLLGFGQDVAGGSDLQQGWSVLLGRAAGVVTRMVGKAGKKFIPVDSISVDPGQGDRSTAGGVSGVTDTASSSYNPLKGAQVNVGKSITDKVFVNWHGRWDEVGPSKDVGLVNNQVGVEYKLLNNVKATASRDFGTADSRLGLEGSKSFAPYKKRKRPTPVPTLTPTQIPVIRGAD